MYHDFIFRNPNLDSDPNVPPDKIDRSHGAGKARRKAASSSVNPVQEGVSKAPATDTVGYIRSHSPFYYC